jgi:hypothetical protein
MRPSAAAGPSTRRASLRGTTDKLTSPVGYQLSEGELFGEVSALGVKHVETCPFANGPDLNQALTVGDPGVFVATDKALADPQKDKWIADSIQRVAKRRRGRMRLGRNGLRFTPQRQA